jgi:hypothetical protein
MAGVLGNYFTEDDYAFTVSSDHLLSKITGFETLHRLGLYASDYHSVCCCVDATLKTHSQSSDEVDGTVLMICTR